MFPRSLALCFCDALSNSKYYKEMRRLKNSSPILNISDCLKKLWHRSLSILLRQLAECWKFSFSQYRNPIFLVGNFILSPWLCFASLYTFTLTFLYADQPHFFLCLLDMCHTTTVCLQYHLYLGEIERLKSSMRSFLL